MKKLFSGVAVIAVAVAVPSRGLKAQFNRADTCFNPINIDYTYMIYNSDEPFPRFKEILVLSQLLIDQFVSNYKF